MKIKMTIQGREGWYDPTSIKVNGVFLGDILALAKANDGKIKKMEKAMEKQDELIETHRQTINRIATAVRKGGIKI